MAINPGKYVTIGGVQYRTGTDLSIAYPGGALDSTDTQATVTTKLYLGVPSGWQASGTNLSYEVTGSESASASGLSWSISASQLWLLVATLTETVTLTYGQSKKFSTTARIKPVFSAGTWTPTVTTSLTIPARPVSGPAAPTSVVAARDGSDTRTKITWAATSTASAPIDSFELRRREKSPAGTWSSYVTIAAAIGGTARSYVDTTTRADRVYQYALRSKNTATVSGFAYSDGVSTTPATPAAPTVKKSGTQIVVTRPPLSAVATHWRVRDNGGAVLATVAAATASWADAAPDPTITHAYQVQAVSTDPTLYSNWSPSSATVQLQAPPNAPTPVSPVSGGAIDATEDNQITWIHNPVDLSDQSAYELGWSPDGTLFQTTGKVASDVEGGILPAGSLTNGGSRWLQYRTWGSHPDPSDWAQILIRTSARPVVGIDHDGTPWPSTTLTLPVTYFDPEGSAMSAWRATLTAGGVLVETLTGNRSTASITFTRRVEDGATYEVTFEAADGVGAWSDPATATVPVAYAVPATPTLEAVFDRDGGFTTLTVTAGTGGDVETDHYLIARAEQGGWVVVADGLEDGQSVTDLTPRLGTTVVYRAVAVSALPSTSAGADVPVVTDACAVLVNFGPGFGDVVKLTSNIDASSSVGRDRERHVFAVDADQRDRRGGWSVTYSDTAVLRDHTITASLFADWVETVGEQSAWADLDALATTDGPVMLRDPLGVHMVGSVGRITRTGHGTAEVKVTIPFWEDHHPGPDLVAL